MRIGQVAKRANVNVQTVRYYERKGLVEPEARTDAGYRAYNEGSVRRIWFIKHAQEIGFSLREIKELLELRTDPHMTCADVKVLAEGKADEVAARISQLKDIRRALHRLIDHCDGDVPVRECAIIEALDEVADVGNANASENGRART